MTSDFNCFIYSLSTGEGSLSQMLEAMLNKSCDQIQNGDINLILDHLKHCHSYYFSEDSKLQADCHQLYNTSRACKDIPWECVENNAVYNIFHYFTDINFMPYGDICQTTLTYSTVFLPRIALNDTEKLQAFYLTKIDGKSLENKDVEIVAMDFHLKTFVFNIYVVKDLPLFVLGLVLVVILMLVYMRSVVLMLTVVIIVAFTIGVSYFLYFMIFR